jgi:hypothetical protein
VLGSFSYQVNTTCVGCAVQSVVGGVTYYDVADQAPAQMFPNDWGVGMCVRACVRVAHGIELTLHHSLLSVCCV